jgi:hypothetical protein
MIFTLLLLVTTVRWFRRRCDAVLAQASFLHPEPFASFDIPPSSHHRKRIGITFSVFTPRRRGLCRLLTGGFPLCCGTTTTTTVGIGRHFRSFNLRLVLPKSEVWSLTGLGGRLLSELESYKWSGNFFGKQIHSSSYYHPLELRLGLLFWRKDDTRATILLGHCCSICWLVRLIWEARSPFLWAMTQTFLWFLLQTTTIGGRLKNQSRVDAFGSRGQRLGLLFWREDDTRVAILLGHCCSISWLVRLIWEARSPFP